MSLVSRSVKNCVFVFDLFFSFRLEILLLFYAKQFARLRSKTALVQSELLVPWDHVIITCVEHCLGSSGGELLDSDLWVSRGNSHLQCHRRQASASERKFVVPSLWLRAEAETVLAVASNTTGRKGWVGGWVGTYTCVYNCTVHIHTYIHTYIHTQVVTITSFI